MMEIGGQWGRLDFCIARDPRRQNELLSPLWGLVALFGADRGFRFAPPLAVFCRRFAASSCRFCASSLSLAWSRGFDLLVFGNAMCYVTSPMGMMRILA